MKPDKAVYKLIDARLNRFLEYLAYQACSCKSPWLISFDDQWRPSRHFGCPRTGHDEKKPHPAQKEGYYNCDQFHHAGHFQRLLSPGPQLPEKHVAAWLKDVEHGLVHGFNTAFVLFWLLKPDGIPEVLFRELHNKEHDGAKNHVRMLLGALFHDFCRTIQPDDPSTHDKRLSQYFPCGSLWPTAYDHRNRPVTEKDMLVGADRIELRRFADWQDWVRTEYLREHIDLIPADQLNYFYRYVRPAIAYLLEYRRSIWFRHGPEREAYVDSGQGVAVDDVDWQPVTPYPLRWVPQPDGGFASIEMGRPPFMDCFWHGRNFLPWGFIPRPVAMAEGAQVMAPPKRDHLAIKSEVPLKHWIFMLGKGCRGHHKDDVPFPCPKLLEHSKGHIELSTATKLVAVVNRILEYLYALRVAEPAEDF